MNRWTSSFGPSPSLAGGIRVGLQGKKNVPFRSSRLPYSVVTSLSEVGTNASN